MPIKNDFTEALEVLRNFVSQPENIKTIESAGDIMLHSLSEGGKIITCGNGGSLCDAMHFAEELTGRFRNDRRALPAIAISDPSHITCVANDYGFEYVFSRYVQAHASDKDVLLAISTSGNSRNIIEAIIAAKEKNAKVVALTGKDGGEIKNLADIEIRVEHFGHSDRIQEIHIKIIHSLIHYIEQHLLK